MVCKSSQVFLNSKNLQSSCFNLSFQVLASGLFADKHFAVFKQAIHREVPQFPLIPFAVKQSTLLMPSILLVSSLPYYG